MFQSIGGCVTSVNDGSDKRYPQATPKERIIAALYDLKQLQAVKEAEDIINSKLPNYEILGNKKGARM